jgi:hypothetical protein
MGIMLVAARAVGLGIINGKDMKRPASTLDRSMQQNIILILDLRNPNRPASRLPAV